MWQSFAQTQMSCTTRKPSQVKHTLPGSKEFGNHHFPMQLLPGTVRERNREKIKDSACYVFQCGSIVHVLKYLGLGHLKTGTATLATT